MFLSADHESTSLGDQMLVAAVEMQTVAEMLLLSVWKWSECFVKILLALPL